MNRRKLGNTGMEVSEIAFGAVEIGMPYGIGVHSNDDMLRETDAIHLLQLALESGINFIDTARQYGTSETLIGKAFEGKRNQVIIATKCKHLSNSSQLTGRDLVKEILGSLRESLTALNTDYIDVYMLHDSDPAIISDPDVISTFSQLKSKGLIRATGISTYTPAETQAVIETGNWDVVQVPFNLMDQRHASLFELASQRGVALVVRSVLMKGLLSTRGKNLHPALNTVEQQIEKIGSFAERLQYSMPALATRFALSFGEVSSVLVGLDKVEYLQESLQVADGNYLAPVQLEQAMSLAYPAPEFLNLHEWNVNGWLK